MKFDFLSQKTVRAITAFILFSGSVGICAPSTKVCTFPDDAKHKMIDMSITVVHDDAKLISVTTEASGVAVTNVSSQQGSPTFTLNDFPARGYSTDVNLNSMNDYDYTNQDVRGESFTIRPNDGPIVPTTGLDCKKQAPQ